MHIGRPGRIIAANDTGWPLVPATARERQDADRFFADLMGGRRDRGRAEEEDAEDLPTEIDLVVRLHGRFGGDLSATVQVEHGRTELATRTVGAAPGDITIRVARHDAYRIVVIPTAAAPNDRYAQTVTTFRPRAPYTSNVVSIGVNVNRWNALNVYDTWDAEHIDRVRARQVSSQPLCGRRVQINRAAQNRLAAANTAFLALPATAQQEITTSLVIIGGYAFRTQSTGGFSNHSLGVAIDVNYNLDPDVLQNNHFRVGNSDEGRHNRAVLAMLQEVVRTDARYATYDVFAARTDLLHWDAAAMFNVLFPAWIEGLVAQAHGRPVPPVVASTATFTASPQPARALGVTRVQIQRASAATTDRELRRTLDLVVRVWTPLQAWLYGAQVPTRGRVRGTLVGLVPMDRRFVELMIGAGWNWGGNWNGSKDFMHFEDRDAFASLRVASAGAPAPEDESWHECHEDEHDVHD